MDGWFATQIVVAELTIAFLQSRILRLDCLERPARNTPVGGKNSAARCVRVGKGSGFVTWAFASTRRRENTNVAAIYSLGGNRVRGSGSWPASALAATPQQIYRDYADNGRLDHKYSQADLQRAQRDAALQGYPRVGVQGAVEQALGAQAVKANGGSAVHGPRPRTPGCRRRSAAGRRHRDCGSSARPRARYAGLTGTGARDGDATVDERRGAAGARAVRAGPAPRAGPRTVRPTRAWARGALLLDTVLLRSRGRSDAARLGRRRHPPRLARLARRLRRSRARDASAARHVLVAPPRLGARRPARHPGGDGARRRWRS